MIAITRKSCGMGLFAVGVGSLSFALIAQYGFDLEPCVLCLIQRVPYAVVAAIGLALVIVPLPGRLGLTLAALTFAIGSAIAVYHVGVEQHWWASATCGAEAGGIMTMEEMLAAIETKPPKPCDQVDWTFLGLSMATYNVFFSFALAGLSLVAARIVGSRSE
ncbi:MAG: disulfide bond formation protein B [Magnetovibrionaceae bacterium]